MWTPDGQRIVFTSNRGGRQELYLQRADGSGTAERLFPTPEGADPIWPFRGGATARRWSSARPARRCNDSGRAQVRAAQPESIARGRGRDVAGRSLGGVHVTMSGQAEVYVERFPQLGDRQKISADFGVNPRWSPDGRTVYYISADGTRFFSVPVSTQAGLTAGVPQLLLRERSSGIRRRAAVRRDT